MTSSVHPGEILREDLVAALGLTVGDAATRLGISRTTLSRVLHGHARVSRNLAARLEQAGEGTARAWLAMQSVHDLAAEPAAGGPKVQHRGPRSALVHRVTAEPHGSILHAPLPMEAYKVLVKVVASMRAGDSPLKGGRELPRHQSSDAGQAAGARRDLVRTSCLGQASTAAAERRLDYQRRKRADRRATLDVLTEQAAEAGPYDGVPDYTEALNAARKRRAG